MCGRLSHVFDLRSGWNLAAWIGLSGRLWIRNRRHESEASTRTGRFVVTDELL